MKKIYYIIMTLLCSILLTSCLEFNFGGNKTPTEPVVTPTPTPVIVYYTVSFNSNGGNDIPSIEVKENSKIESLPTPTKENYTFSGWYKESGLTNKWDLTKDVVNGEITLFAKWTKIENSNQKSYTISFNINGHGEQPNNITDVKAIPTSLPVLSESGWNFIGWYTDENLTSEVVLGNTLRDDLVLYAKWVEIELPTEDDPTSDPVTTYSITYINNGHGQKPSDVNSVTKLPALPVLTESGWNFIGWYYEQAFITLAKVNDTLTSDVTLYAKWEEIKQSTPEDETVVYCVTFKNDNEIFDQVDVQKGNKLVAPTTNPSKTGYNFVGWSTSNSSKVLFDFNTEITSELTLYAYYEQITSDEDDSINVTLYSGYNEGAYIEFDSNGYNAADFEITYSTSSTTYKLDSELIRKSNNTVRADILGLSKGTYTITIKNLKTNDTISKDVNVSSFDRSGYAHFNNTAGVGAYNNDGTLKANAIVVYVNDQNKNTVSIKVGSKTYTGLGNILANAKNINYPICVRVIGSVKTAQWNAKTHGTGKTSARQENLNTTFNNAANFNNGKLYYDSIVSAGINSMSNDINSGITILNGLTTCVLYDGSEYDSYYNMLDVNTAENVTVEGVGTDASIYQWGINFKKCNSIEVRNLTFSRYTEDALGFEGDSSNISTYGDYWIHHCTFNIGVNNWDVCYEADKGDGDGSTDFKYCKDVTIDHCNYISTHKTILIGGSDSAKQYNFTLHHNYFKSAESRLPLVRQGNIHIYNNYFYNAKVCSSVRANSFAFIENNYYENCQNPIHFVKNSTYTGTAVKSFGNLFSGCTTSSNSSSDTYYKQNTVTNRTDSVSGNCNPTGSSNLTNFDTNSSLFYYDSTNKVSKVSNMLPASDVKKYCVEFAGVLKGNFVNQEPTTPETPDVEEPAPEDPTTETTYISFNNFTTGAVSESTVNNVTVVSNSTKSCEIASVNTTLANQQLTKYFKVGGGGSYTSLCVKFNTTAKANITVYFASGGETNLRYAALYDSANNKTESTVGSSSKSSIVNYTFTNVSAGNYSIASSGSGLNIYLIVIEYI